MEHHEHACNHKAATTALHQNIDELEFERGIWKAAIDNDIDRVDKLISKTDDSVNKRDNSGYTALHYAARAGHIAVCKLLINSGAQVNAQLPSGDTALHRACYTGRTEVVKLLLNNNSQALPGADHQSPLHKSAEQGHLEVSQLLVRQFPALVAVRDSKGRTPQDLYRNSTTIEDKEWIELLHIS